MATKEIWFQQSGIKRSRRSKQREWEKRIRTTAFYPQPTSVPRSYEEHRPWTPRSAVRHSCLPPRDQPSPWWQGCKIQSLLQVASPATRTSSHWDCREAIPLLGGEGWRLRDGAAALRISAGGQPYNTPSRQRSILMPEGARACGMGERCWACLGSRPRRSCRHQPGSLHEVILVDREHGREIDPTVEMGRARALRTVPVGPTSSEGAGLHLAVRFTNTAALPTGL